MSQSKVITNVVESKYEVIESLWPLKYGLLEKKQSMQANVCISANGLVFSNENNRLISSGIQNNRCKWWLDSPLSLLGGLVAGFTVLFLFPESNRVSSNSNQRGRQLPLELSKLACIAGLEKVCYCSNHAGSTFFFTDCDPAHLNAPLDKVAKLQHKENQRQMDWILVFFASSPSWHYAASLLSASPPWD